MILSILGAILAPLSTINTAVLWVGRQVSWVLIGLMVVVISVQVFYRYVLNNALPYPEELARVMMIWMMALIAPSAYRWGGFVSITMILDALPHKIGRLINIVLMVMAGIVLAYLLHFAFKHYNSGFIFKSSTLKIPLAYIYASMSICFGLMFSVNCELILRLLGQFFNGDSRFDMPKNPLNTERN